MHDCASIVDSIAKGISLFFAWCIPPIHPHSFSWMNDICTNYYYAKMYSHKKNHNSLGCKQPLRPLHIECNRYSKLKVNLYISYDV